MKLITLGAPGTHLTIMVCQTCNAKMDKGEIETPRTEKGSEYCQVYRGLTNFPFERCEVCNAENEPQ